MNVRDLLYDFRRSEVLKRRAMGRAGRMAEREGAAELLKVLNDWIENYGRVYQDVYNAHYSAALETVHVD